MLIITVLESTDADLYSPMQSKIHPTDPSPPQASTRKLGTSRKKLSLGDIKTMRLCLSCICIKASLGPIIKVILWIDNTAAKQTYPTLTIHTFPQWQCTVYYSVLHAWSEECNSRFVLFLFSVMGEKLWKSNPLSCQNIETESVLAHCFYTFDC